MNLFQAESNGRMACCARPGTLGDCLCRAVPCAGHEVPNPPNADAAPIEAYVVLVSLDGFRYDYTERYGAKNLLDMALRGVSAPERHDSFVSLVTFRITTRL